MHTPTRYKKLSLGAAAVLYGAAFLLLATLTLFDMHFARGGLRFVAWDHEKLNNYLRHSLNMVPFATILSYIRRFFQGEISRYVFVYNIFGNLAALMPLGFFLPLLFVGQQRWKAFVPTMVGIVAVIELLQFATLSGSCDIDDVILNVSGACLIFALQQKTPLGRLARRLFLLEGARE